MTEADAINFAKAHAARWVVPWRQILKTQKENAGWFSLSNGIPLRLTLAMVKLSPPIHLKTASVNRFEYYPSDPKGLLLPLWAAFPTYTSVTIGWRQGEGEQYKYKWHSFYQGLSEDDKTEYRRRFPPPDDEERCWQDFYKWFAH